MSLCQAQARRQLHPLQPVAPRLKGRIERLGRQCDDSGVLTAETAADYLAAYALRYRAEYELLTGDPPSGAGFPAIISSPYLEEGHVVCLLGLDGAVVFNPSHEPPYDWAVAGGPALMVDYRDPYSRVPQEIIARLRSQGLLGQSIGIFRITFPESPVADYIWQGLLPEPTEQARREINGGLMFDVQRLDLNWLDIIQRLTFGAYAYILDLKLPSEDAEFWQPVVVRDLGFVTADRQHHRFFHYLELVRHVHESAWEVRTAWARAKIEARKDMADAIAMQGRSGGTMTLPSPYGLLLEGFRDRLQELEDAVAGFASLLNDQHGADESVFQRFLESHPLLLDVYGEVIPRPRFEYPQGASPLGKAFVEPDFIIRSPGDRYTLVEIERPSKLVSTRRGQARAEVTQATFQIAEFKDYIIEHYDRLKDKFPGINRDPLTVVIISRSTEESFGGRQNIRRQTQLLREQFGANELLTYDDLLARARMALVRLSGLSPTSSRCTPGDLFAWRQC